MKFQKDGLGIYPAILIEFTAKKQTARIAIPMPDYENVNPDIEGIAKQTVNAIYYFIDKKINGQMDGCGEPIALIESDLVEPLNHIFEACRRWLDKGAEGDVSFKKAFNDEHCNHHNVDILLSRNWCLLGR